MKGVYALAFGSKPTGLISLASLSGLALASLGLVHLLAR
jgi:hypothetical protein